MALQPLQATRRRSVSPTTSTLHMLVEDIDCSALTAAPEDGQFIVAVSKTGQDGAGLTLNHDNAGSVDSLGAGLSMVWGSAQRSDRQARGDARVPVIRKGGGRFRTKCFLRDDNDGDLSTKYIEGAALTVAPPATALQGSTDRLMITTVSSAAGNDNCWVIGYCIRVITDSIVSGTGEIEFYLYDQPRLVQTDD